MPARLHIHRIEPANPAAAANALARRLAEGAPSARPLLVAIVAGAGQVVVAPWTIDGIRAAFPDALFVDLGHAHEVPSDGGGHDDVSLAWPGAARPLRVPNAWLGRRLYLVSPCTIRPGHNGRSAEGPVTAAFAALAVAAGAVRAGHPARLGERLAARLFAHVAVIVDASWAAVAEPRPVEDVLVPTERCVGAVLQSPTAGSEATHAHDVDTWLARRLGVPGPMPLLALTGDAADAPWPAAQAPVPTLAAREVPALWQPEAAVARRSARPRRPGALGRTWDAWLAERSS